MWRELTYGWPMSKAGMPFEEAGCSAFHGTTGHNRSMPAVHILHDGYVGEGVASTVALIDAGPVKAVVDPGMVSDESVILGPLVEFGYSTTDVTDVIFSHHHPDHTLHVALFLPARVHDHWAIYEGDQWTSRPAEGFEVVEGVRLIETPGHTPQDITTLVDTDDGVLAFTHLWWNSEGPAEDPLAADPVALHAGRERVLEVASLIVPGHGPAFVPDDNTPR